jgi:HEAT repeat protein
MSSRRLRVILPCAMVAACAAEPARRADPQGQGTARDAVQTLLDAQPQDWVAAGAGVGRHAGAAVQPLVEGLEARPWSPGAQPAIALLGAFGDPAAVPVLRKILRSSGAAAYEAALALGALRAEPATQDLREILADAGKEPLLRTACAAALLDLGDRTLSVPFFHALFSVDTDVGRDAARAQGLASKPRWALEREVAIAAISRATGGDALGLDADSPWPAMAAAAERMRERLGTAPSSKGK